MTEVKAVKPATNPPPIPWEELPLSVQRVLGVVPSRKWYQVRAILPKHEETIELVQMVSILEFLLDVAPMRCVHLLRRNPASSAGIDQAFTGVREGLGALREACRKLATLSGIEIRAWREEKEPLVKRPVAAAPPPPVSAAS